MPHQNQSQQTYRLGLFIIFIIICFITPRPVSAHAYSVAYTTLTLEPQATQFDFSIDVLSVIEGIGGDTNKDGTLDDQEIAAERLRIESWVSDSVVLEVNKKEQRSELKSIQVQKKSDKNFITLHFSCPPIPSGQTVSIIDGLYTQGNNVGNANYADFIKANVNGSLTEGVLQGKNREWTMIVNTEGTGQDPQDQSQQSAPAPTTPSNTAQHPTTTTATTSATSGWWAFFKLGMNHILTGYDHLLFLLALLIRKQTFKQYATMITAFTVAHSLTLSLAVLNIIDLPSRWVEAAIAFSICYVAVENIFRKEIRMRWLVTFFFGLIHGIGFSDILKEMALSKSDLAVDLVSFNLGIEAVQLIILALLFTALIWLQKRKGYHMYVKYVSYVVLLCGGVWLIQRIFM